MVTFDYGQAIIGGFTTWSDNDKIYLMTCHNRNCKLTTLNQQGVSRGWFVVMPVPDNYSTQCSSYQFR